MKPRALDLFCGAGGMARGLQMAGFHVTGVDLVRPTHYAGDVFIQGNALEMSLEGYDLIHASPKCQFATAYRRRPGHVKPSENQIPAIRERLATHRPYVPWIIENVGSAREHMVDPTLLCGSMFGLPVRRHRLFETSFPVLVGQCLHGLQTGSYPQATNRTNRRRTMEIGVYRIPLAEQKSGMGIDWPVTLHELSQAIPPAYGEYVGRAAMAAIGGP